MLHTINDIFEFVLTSVVLVLLWLVGGYEVPSMHHMDDSFVCLPQIDTGNCCLDITFSGQITIYIF